MKTYILGRPSFSPMRPHKPRTQARATSLKEVLAALRARATTPRERGSPKGIKQYIRMLEASERVACKSRPDILAISEYLSKLSKLGSGPSKVSIRSVDVVVDETLLAPIPSTRDENGHMVLGESSTLTRSVVRPEWHIVWET